MVERTVSLDPQKAYEELRNLLLKNGCKIVREDPPRSIEVEHGNVYGYTPKSIEKRITFTLIPYGNTTRIISNTSITKDYIYASVFSILYIILLAGIFWYIISFSYGALSIVGSKIPTVPKDLQEYILYTQYREALKSIQTLAIIFYILVIAIIFFIAFGIYSYLRRDRFSEEILKHLP